MRAFREALIALISTTVHHLVIARVAGLPKRTRLFRLKPSTCGSILLLFVSRSGLPYTRDPNLPLPLPHDLSINTQFLHRLLQLREKISVADGIMGPFPFIETADLLRSSKIHGWLTWIGWCIQTLLASVDFLSKKHHYILNISNQHNNHPHKIINILSTPSSNSTRINRPSSNSNRNNKDDLAAMAL
jgi:hypothetical protein